MIKLRQMNSEINVTPILPSIQTPTLVIHRVGDVRVSIEHARDMAAAIPNARMIELSGKDHFVWLEESGTVLTEIRNFVDTAQQPIEPDRVLTTVLFTDIVDFYSASRGSWRHGMALDLDAPFLAGPQSTPSVPR